MLKNAGGSQLSGGTVPKCKKKRIIIRKEDCYMPSRTVHISELNILPLSHIKATLKVDISLSWISKLRFKNATKDGVIQ